ncbi:MAG: M23 family metallopeptidase [Gammaproteobacteria bacterium]|nr:M23 family metallopeptidase [Gammaproteobacteria bacterium]
MKTRVIINLFVVLVFSALAGVAYGVTKIAPTQAEAGHPFTIIDTPKRRLIGGSVAVFKLGGLEVLLSGRTRKPYNTMQGRLAPDMFGGEYTVFVRQPDGTEFEIGLFTVLGPTAPPPSIAPDIGAPGDAFTINDPLARMQSGDLAVFYAEGTDPAIDGVSDDSVVVSPDGTSLSGNVPAGAAQGVQNFVSVRPDTTADSRFGDLGFFVTVGSDVANLITPYVNESDMSHIFDVFSSDISSPPRFFVHDGIDIYPQGDLKSFQAACSGRVQKIYTFDDQVTIFIACNSTYTIDYNFESQAPQTGQTQLANIMVVEDQIVSQGEIIGYLYAAANPTAAHVHFTFYKNWIPSCPEPYFDQAARDSILKLIHETDPNINMCYGPNVTPPALATPYLNEFDMSEINAGFSSDNSISPWGFVHDGIDIFPQGDLKPFQAACSGVVDSVELRQASVDSNWQVEVLIQCDDYVSDPAMGGYFIPFSVNYIFEPMSDNQMDGQTQLLNIMVAEGQNVTQRDIIGNLVVVGEEAHVHFGLVQFGSSTFSALGITSIPLCPEPHFSTEGKDSILKLLHVVWPSASMCYQD